MFRMYMLKMDKAGGEGGAGGSGGGQGGDAGGGNSGGAGANTGGDKGVGDDPLFGKGGEGAGAGKGGDGSGGDKGGAQGAGGDKSAGAAGDKGSAGANTVTIPENWKEALPEELRGEASLNLVKDIPTLVKNYINAQKHIGMDKVVIPGKNATTEDWKEAFHKMGNPRDIKEYIVELEKGTEIDSEFFEQFKGKAHELGVMPRQAKELVQWFAKLNKEVNEKADTESLNGVKAEMSKLKKEWGTAWDANVIRARAAMAEYVDKDTQAAFQKMGLGQNPAFLKVLSKIGETLSEDAIKRHTGVESGVGSMSPAQALQKIAEIKGDPKHPYWNKDTEGHAKAKKEMDNLFQMAHPKSK
jgi:hypothetical protein